MGDWVGSMPSAAEKMATDGDGSGPCEVPRESGRRGLRGVMAGNVILGEARERVLRALG